MDPDPEQLALAKQVGADRIELYTGPYAHAFATQDNLEAVYQQFYRAAEKAAEIGLGLNAGHDLNLHNLPHFSALPSLLEVSIGHAFTVDAIELGLVNAIGAWSARIGQGSDITNRARLHSYCRDVICAILFTRTKHAHRCRRSHRSLRVAGAPAPSGPRQQQHDTTERYRRANQLLL